MKISFPFDLGLCPKNPQRNFLKKVSLIFKNFSKKSQFFLFSKVFGKVSENLFSKRFYDKRNAIFAYGRTRDLGLCPENPQRNFLKKVSLIFKNFSKNKFILYFSAKFLERCRKTFFQKAGLCPENSQRNFLKKVSLIFKSFSKNKSVLSFQQSFWKGVGKPFFKKVF